LRFCGFSAHFLYYKGTKKFTDYQKIGFHRLQKCVKKSNELKILSFATLSIIIAILANENTNEMPMKSIRNTLNIVLSAIIVALGFGSCVSHRAYQAAQQEIKQF